MKVTGYIKCIDGFLRQKEEKKPPPKDTFSLATTLQNFLTEYMKFLNTNIYSAISIIDSLPQCDIEKQHEIINNTYINRKEIAKNGNLYKKPILRYSPSFSKKQVDNFDNESAIEKNLNFDTLSLKSEILSLNQYYSKKSIEYDEPSLQEYLNSEVINIKKSKTHTRPFTPEVVYSKSRPKINRNVNNYTETNTLENQNAPTGRNINILKNKNLENKKHTYTSFRRNNIVTKPKNLKTHNAMFIKLQKGTKPAKILSEKVLSSTRTKLNSQKIPPSFSRPLTSNTSRNVSFSHTSKGKQLNIKIDIRDLMRDDFEQCYTDNAVN